MHQNRDQLAAVTQGPFFISFKITFESLQQSRRGSRQGGHPIRSVFCGGRSRKSYARRSTYDGRLSPILLFLLNVKDYYHWLPSALCSRMYRMNSPRMAQRGEAAMLFVLSFFLDVCALICRVAGARLPLSKLCRREKRHGLWVPDVISSHQSFVRLYFLVRSRYRMRPSWFATG